MEPVVAAGLVTLLGLGAAVALAGAGSSKLDISLLGGAILGVALLGLVATDWIDGTSIAIIAIPLPALISAGSIRVAAAAPITAIIIFAWFLRWGVRGGVLRVGRLPVRTLIALVLAFLLAAVAGTSPVTSMREVLNILVLLVFLVLVLDRFLHDRSRLHSAVTLLACTAALIGGLAVLEMVGIIPGVFPRYGTPFNRAALGFGQPNGLGLFLAVAIPLVAYVARHVRGAAGVAARIGLPISLLGLVATFSRGAWVSLLAGSTALLFARGGRFVTRIWLAAILFIVVADIGTGGALRDTAERSQQDWSIAQRLILQLVGVRMFLDNPVLGVGPGAFEDHIETYGAQIPGLVDFQTTPHNAYIQMAAEAGAVGFLAFTAFLGAGLLVAIRSARQAARVNAVPADRALRGALVWSFATACFNSLFLWPFAHGTGQAVLIVAAAAFALAAEPPRAAQPAGAG